MKKKFWNPPLYGGSETFAWLHRHKKKKKKKKKKNENSDYVSIMVQMCSNEPETNAYDI